MNRYLKKKMSLCVAFILAVEICIGGVGGSQSVKAAEAVNVSASPPKLTFMNPSLSQNLSRTPKITITVDKAFDVNSSGIAGIRVVDLTDKGKQPITIDTSRLKKATDRTMELQLTDTETLAYNHQYEVQFDAQLITDETGNGSEYTTYQFKTLSKLEAVRYSPEPNAIGVSTDKPVLSITFNEDVALGKGTVQIIKAADNRPVDQLTIQQGQNNDAVAKVSDRTVTFYPTKTLERNTTYYVLIAKGAITTKDGIAYEGINNGSQWYFKTVADTAIKTLAPLNNASSVPLNTKLQLTFSNSVYPGTGNIELYKSNGSKIASINVQSTQVTGGDSPAITINPGVTLQNNSKYYVIVPNGAFRDKEGNSINGITSAGGWTFSTAVDTSTSTGVQISSLSPSNGSTNVASDSDLVVTFNREVLRGNGDVSVRKSGTSTYVPVDVYANGTREVLIRLQSGNSYDVNSTYYVTIDRNAFYDKYNSSNDFAGLSGGWSFQTNVTDKKPLELQNAEMYNSNTIRLEYNKELYSDSYLQNSSFSVTVNDETRRISNVYASGSSVFIYLDTGVAVGQNVKISYSGGSWPVRDLAGNAAATFSMKEVVNGIDTVLPKPKDGWVSGSTLTLSFSQQLKSPSSNAYEQFNVKADDTSVGINRMSQSGQTITLTLSSDISDGQVVKVSYTPGSDPIQDSRGQNISEFSDFIVRNYRDTKPPVFEEAEGAGTQVTLNYNELLSTKNVPMKSQFSVLVNDAPNYVDKVEIKGTQVILTVATALNKDAKVTISYVPGTNRLTDLNGNAAGYINLEPVNVTGYGQVGDVKSATVQGDTIQAIFVKTLVSIPTMSVNQFQVLVDGAPRGITSASVSGNTLTIKLSSPVISGQKVELSYIPGVTPLKDTSGNYLLYFNKIPVSGMTSSAVGPVNSNRPAFLTMIDESEFGQAMLALGSQATKVSDIKSRNGQYIKRYLVDSDKLKQAYEYIVNSNERVHTVVVDAATGLNSAYVSVPLNVLENAYNQDRSAAFAVKAGDAVYYVPLDKVNFAEIARSLNTTSSSVTLNITVERLSAEATAVLSSKLNLGSSQKITEPVDFYISAANNTSASYTTEINQYGEYFIRTSTQIPDNRSGLVQFDTQADKLTFVPSVIENQSGRKIFHAKVKSNHTVMGITYYKYYGDLSNHWAKDEISVLSARLIVEGRSNTLFEPNKNITRAEFAEYVARALGLPGDTQTSQKFYDVTNSSANAFIGAAAKAGIIMGNTDGSFKPNDSITREQMVLMMMRAMNYAGYQTPLNFTPDTYLQVFKDKKDIKSPDAVAKLVKEGVIQGMTANTFEPKGKATRAQAVVMLKRLLEKIGYM